MAEPQGMLSKLAPFLLGGGAGLLSSRGQIEGLGSGLLQGGELAQQQLLNKMRLEQAEREKLEQAQKDEQLERVKRFGAAVRAGSPDAKALAADSYPELVAKHYYPSADSGSTSAIMNMAEYERRIKAGDVEGAKQLLLLASPPVVRDFGDRIGMVDRMSATTTNVGNVGLAPEQRPENIAAGQAAKTGAEAQAKRDFNMEGLGDIIAEAKGVLTGPVKPTSSGAGSLIDKGAAFVGASLPGADEAANLKAIGGALVAKMPRMEGPQSDRDTANYQAMAGRVGDDTLPVSQRLSALMVVERLWRKYDTGQRSNARPDAQPAGKAKPVGEMTIEELEREAND